MTVQFVIDNWYLFAMAAAIIVMLLSEPIRRRASGIRSVSALELPPLLRDDAVILDVSEPHEFKKSHIPNSVNIPLKKLSGDLGKLGKNKSKTIVIICRAGNRSAAAARLLTKQGFESVYTLAGGLLAWEKEKFPMERG
jgi:rhodanese-related sulfurtransferase